MGIATIKMRWSWVCLKLVNCIYIKSVPSKFPWKCLKYMKAKPPNLIIYGIQLWEWFTGRQLPLTKSCLHWALVTCCRHKLSNKSAVDNKYCCNPFIPLFFFWNTHTRQPISSMRWVLCNNIHNITLTKQDALWNPFYSVLVHHLLCS